MAWKIEYVLFKAVERMRQKKVKPLGMGLQLILLVIWGCGLAVLSSYSFAWTVLNVIKGMNGSVVVDYWKKYD